MSTHSKIMQEIFCISVCICLQKILTTKQSHYMWMKVDSEIGTTNTDMISQDTF